MLKIERQTMIERELEKQGCVLVPALSGLLHCSEETVRRDLKEMEFAGKLTRTHGGAYLLEKYDKSYPTNLRKTYFQGTKSRLARQALHYVQENEVIMLDSSTTCLTFAEALLREKISLTIITNSLPICDLCSESNADVNLVCVGGTFRRRTTSFTGYHTTDVLGSYRADKAFVSCPKVTLEYGLSDNHINEARVRECMFKHAQSRYLLLDHTKFGPSANVLFDGLSAADVIITDQKLPPEWEEFAQRSQIVVDYCPE